MKIGFLISNIHTKSQGNGGHYYSLTTTAKVLSKHFNIVIINIGTDESLALNKSEGLSIVNVLSSKNKLNTLGLFKSTKEVLKKEKVDVIHAFDDLAYLFGRVTSFFLHKPIVLTKCGGPNPKFYYPKSKNLITYSEENFRYFKSKKKYKKSNIYLIPNRVTYSKQDEERIGELNSTYRLGGYDYVFLRIARIGNAYKKTIKQLLNLHEKLAKDFRCCTLIIGSIEDETVYKDLKKNQQEHVHFITENKYTIKANELIDVADVVLGTGRSFMEAAIQKKLMLATIANSDYPILVNEDNFKQLSGFNFSPRAIINDSNEQKTLSAIQNVLSAKNQYKEFVQLNIKMFNSSFKVDEVVGKYIDIYKNIEFKYRVNLLDTIKNVLFLVRVYNQNKKAAK